ncbi:MAG TPA: FAD-dependent oxidoreductase [Burkholderiaceae bacterium]|nr:FAD-dependent oxidoreductase [Burkholderiaceae bacterium]
MFKKKLVVIGGGAAGHKIAYLLQDLLDVTLVDPKTYFEVPMALPRLLVEPGALPAQMRYQDFLSSVRHVQGRAASISVRSVVVDTSTGSETIPFDYAVVATGSRHVDPLIKADVAGEGGRRSQIVAAHERLKTARHVVVAGGGPVGVEIAAELCESFPRLSVTLMHGTGQLLENAPAKFGEWALDKLIAMGANVLLDDPVTQPAIGTQPLDGKVRTKGGKVLQADLVIWAAGARPNTGFMAASWPQLVQADGLLKTDEYLRLQGYANIFIAGDVTNLPEGRLAITASFHVPAIVANIKAMLPATPADPARLKPYVPRLPGKGMGKLMIVTLGRRDGLTSLPFGQFRAAFIARKIKSANMFVNQYRKDVGLL